MLVLCLTPVRKTCRGNGGVRATVDCGGHSEHQRSGKVSALWWHTGVLRLWSGWGPLLVQVRAGLYRHELAEDLLKSAGPWEKGCYMLQQKDVAGAHPRAPQRALGMNDRGLQLPKPPIHIPQAKNTPKTTCVAHP